MRFDLQPNETGSFKIDGWMEWRFVGSGEKNTLTDSVNVVVHAKPTPTPTHAPTPVPPPPTYTPVPSIPTSGNGGGNGCNDLLGRPSALTAGANLALLAAPIALAAVLRRRRE